MKSISIAIADDHQLFADGLRLLLTEQKDFEICWLAADGPSLLNMLAAVHCDVLLLDINMPGMNGLDALEHIRKRDSTVKVIILSTYTDAHLVSNARKNGANGYLVKTFGPDELAKAIRIVNAGESYFHVTGIPGGRSGTGSGPGPTGDDPFLKQFNLTKREKEILRLIKESLTNAQISEKLYLSVYTVETHRKNIMQKLGLKSPGSLMRWIIENHI